MSQAICPDCGATYYDMAYADHLLICDAHTCDVCTHIHTRVVPQNQYGERVCEICQAQEETGEYEYSGDEKEEEGDE